jgi:acyl-CoA synthetase (AMP-forming)/AMP-acid ligase II
VFARTVAETDPDRVAFVMAASGERLTFGEFEAAANRLAHLFRDQGLAEGDHAAFLMTNSPGVLVAYGAAERTGLQYTPVDFHLTADEAAYIVNDCAARVVIVNADVAAVAAALPARCPKVERWLIDTTAEVPAGFERLADAVAGHPSDPVPDERLGIAMMYSSGTTGRPKGIMRPLPGIDAALPLPVYAMVGEVVYRMREGLTLLQPGPLYHAGPQSSTSIAFRLGGTTVVMDRFDARRYLELVGEYGVTHSVVVPTMMSRLLALPSDVRRSASLGSFEALVHGAAPCPANVKRGMIDWLGPIVYEYYGATEANGGTTVDSHEWLARPGTVGRPYMGEIVIRGEDGAELPVGTPGQVWFRGNTNFVYWADEEKTASNRDPDGSTSTTGDIGYVDEDGYLYLTDRTAFTIISGGVNVYPQEIETVLHEHPEVADVAVLAAPNADLGEEVKAVVSLRPGPAGEPVDVEAAEQRLIDYCRGRLSRIKVPRSVDFVAEVPRLATGKLNKRLLHDRYWKKV